MNWINIIVVGVLISVAMIFATSNVEVVQVGFAGLKSGEIPLYVPILVAFLIGFAGGVLALSFSRRKHKNEISELRRENELLSQEVENLRNIPLQDDV